MKYISFLTFITCLILFNAIDLSEEIDKQPEG